MIPAEARNIIDTLNSIIHDKELVYDAYYCLCRMKHESQRDRDRAEAAMQWLAEREEAK